MTIYIPRITLQCSDRLKKYQHLVENVGTFKFLARWLKDISLYINEAWPEIPDNFTRHCFHVMIPHKIVQTVKIRIVRGSLFTGISINCGGKYRFAVGSTEKITSYVHDAQISLLNALNVNKLITPEPESKENNQLWSLPSPIMHADMHGWNAYISMKVCGHIPKDIVTTLEPTLAQAVTNQKHSSSMITTHSAT